MFLATTSFAILLATILPYVGSINCYSYRSEKNDISATHSRFINCEREFGIPSHACLKAEFLIDGSKEFIMGYCGDICPAIFHSHHCIYQDVGENFPLLRQMIGTSSAIAVCCCENDLCNGVENLSIIKFQQLLLITLNFILLNLFQFIFYSL